MPGPEDPPAVPPQESESSESLTPFYLGIVITHAEAGRLLESFNPEMLPLGTNLEIYAGQEFCVRHVTRQDEEGNYYVDDNYVIFRGRNDHMKIEGQSYATFLAAPDKVQGKLRFFSDTMAVPGISDDGPEDGNRDLIFSFKYKGSPLSILIETYADAFGDKVSPQRQVKAIRDIDLALQTDSNLQRYSRLRFLTVGSTQPHELRHVYDYYVRPEGQGLPPYIANTRTAVFLDTSQSRPRLIGGLIAVGEDEIPRWHTIMRYDPKVIVEGKGKSRRITEPPPITPADVAKWCAIMESASVIDMAPTLPGSTLRSDLSRQLFPAILDLSHPETAKWQDVTPQAILGTLVDAGYNPDAILSMRRRQALTLRFQDPEILAALQNR